MFDEISRHLLDIYQNSTDAGATLVRIKITVSEKEELLKIKFDDNGRGFSEHELKNALNPFYTTKNTRKTGLGLPLFKQSALITGGSFKINSSKIGGIHMEVDYNIVSPDCPMLGNLSEDLAAAVLLESAADIVFEFNSQSSRLVFDTRLIREGEKADSLLVWSFIREYIRNNEKALEINSYGKNIFRNKEENMKIEELNAIRDKMKSQVTLRAEDPNNTKVIVAMGTCGISAGAREVLNAFAEEIAQKDIKNVMVSQTGCIGMCQYEPIVEIYEKDKDKVTYVNMNADKAHDVIEKHLIGGQIAEEYTI